VLVTTTKA